MMNAIVTSWSFIQDREVSVWCRCKNARTSIINFFSAVLFLFLFSSCNQDKTPVSGTYRISSTDPVARMLLAGENTYIRVNNDGTILYNTTLNQKPKFHIQGTYTLDEKTNTLQVKWESGKLPNKLTVQQEQQDFVIRIGETLYIKERTAG